VRALAVLSLESILVVSGFCFLLFPSASLYGTSSETPPPSSATPPVRSLYQITWPTPPADADADTLLGRAHTPIIRLPTTAAAREGEREGDAAWLAGFRDALGCAEQTNALIIQPATHNKKRNGSLGPNRIHNPAEEETKKRRDTGSRSSVEGGNHAKERKEERKTEHARIIPLFQNKNVYESLTSISLFHRETGKTGAFRGRPWRRMRRACSPPG
jgi:hypothetical protein